MIDVVRMMKEQGTGGQRALTQDGFSIRDNSMFHILREGSGAV